MDMRIYRAPSGLMFQYREGHAPEGYVLVADEQPEAASKPKRRTTANKARKTENK